MSRLGLWWTEVRRRHVLRVAVWYLAGAWVLAQVADLLFDAFDLADYTRFVIAALVAGLPVALALAWIFDITPRGIERTLALAPAGGADDVLPAAPAPENSIAVLPFTNLSRDPADEYFSDGLAEEIRNQLARVPGLRVAARTSSFAFKGRHEDARNIGRKLNVLSLLEGGVRRHEDRVRIDVQLVCATDGYQVWSHTFERRLGDVFQLQSEVSQAVIDAVGRRHGQPLRPPAEIEGPGNFEAYNAYLLGRHHFHKRTEPSLRRAAELFQRAVELDTGYALAYTGIADAALLLSARHYGNLSMQEALARARPAVEEALRLAPGLAEAHASFGLVQLNEGDPDAAVRSFERALELNPGYSMAHVWLGLALLAQGRYVEAAERNLRVYRLDPLAPIVVTNAGFDALRFGRDEEARERFLAAIELDPRFPVPCSGMSRLEATRGNLREGLRWVERAIEVAPGRAFYHARRGLLLLQSCRLDEAEQAVDEARARAPDNVFDAELIVALHMARADREALGCIASGAAARAFGQAQRAYASVALGRYDEALALYDAATLSACAELDQILNDDWVWRLPHSITRAHLRLAAGDATRAREELENFVSRAERLLAQGIVSGEVRYWTATACLLLGRVEQAADHLQVAVDGGWRHGWWARLDWNLLPSLSDPRIAALVKQAEPADAAALCHPEG
ncbi:MAG TPA: tetratricopeptide repeat protein [Steroidobacteraceae bacterium]|nr:tetratricopeptide repeat protein [Steroidobacteraceae bacterium]